MTHRKGPRPKRENKKWTGDEVKRLKKLADGNTPTPLISDAMGRTVSAIQNKASEVKKSLKPTNRSPYNRRKK